MNPKATVDRTSAVFQSSSTTYNQSSVQYSQSTMTYGGSDRRVDQGPKPQGIVIPTPKLSIVSAI